MFHWMGCVCSVRILPCAKQSMSRYGKVQNQRLLLRQWIFKELASCNWYGFCLKGSWACVDVVISVGFGIQRWRPLLCRAWLAVQWPACVLLGRPPIFFLCSVVPFLKRMLSTALLPRLAAVICAQAQTPTKTSYRNKHPLSVTGSFLLWDVFFFFCEGQSGTKIWKKNLLKLLDYSCPEGIQSHNTLLSCLQMLWRSCLSAIQDVMFYVT